MKKIPCSSGILQGRTVGHPAGNVLYSSVKGKRIILKASLRSTVVPLPTWAQQVWVLGAKVPFWISRMVPLSWFQWVILLLGRMSAMWQECINLIFFFF